MIYSKIIASGSYLPAKSLSNFDLEKIVDTTDEWIVSRSGIHQRHIAAEDEMTSDLALQASLRAIDMAGIAANDIDLIIVATTSPDKIFPSTACILQHKLGIVNGGAAFDIQAVCGGFVYALNTANLYIRGGQAKTVLVVGSEIMSRLLDWTDRTTCVLFGDGAGAVILKASDEPGILAARLHSDGRHHALLMVDGSVSNGISTGDPFVRMEGQAVFKFAVTMLARVVDEVLTDAGLTSADIDWLVPHQANIRIIEATAKKSGLGMEHVVVTVANHGNTSSASIPLALDAAVRDGRIQPGHKVMFEAIGGGFTWGALLLKW